MTTKGQTNKLLQWEYLSTTYYNDPFNNIELDILITSPNGRIWKIPAFWAGKQTWIVRFIPKEVGIYQVQTLCSDTKNSSLHNVNATLDIIQGSASLQKNLNISYNHQYLEDKQKNAFFWLSDTWWMALSKRLSYPNDFKSLTSRRKAQGFNVIMLVAGLFPDMDSFDERGSNEAGFPWETGYTRINPAYFDKADERISHLVNEGFIPCILGSWGYYLQHLGEKKMKQHWRYIIARWGAYSVVWCIAGEATMPYYLSTQRTKDMYALHEGWTRLAHYIKAIEPFENLITIHPTEVGRDQLQEPSLLDFNLLQSGHNGYQSIQDTIKLITQERYREPIMPTLIGETNYEGILDNNYASMQRFSFWAAILSGSKGYSYGANGVWQVNTKEKPFGESPNNNSWGDVPWKESYLYQGAIQISLAKIFLEKYQWWLLEPQQNYLSPQHNTTDRKAPLMAGIGSTLRIAYFYQSPSKKYYITFLATNIIYNAFFWDPQTAQKYPIGLIQSDKYGKWKIPTLPTLEDWIIILEAQETTKHKISEKKSYIHLTFISNLKMTMKKLFKK